MNNLYHTHKGERVILCEVYSTGYAQVRTKNEPNKRYLCHISDLKKVH